MFDDDANSLPSQNDEHNNSSAEYLRLAAQACASGDAVLGMHLYLAAFGRALHGGACAPDESAIEGLKQAWRLACALKERSIAEYVFERLEPYLSSEESAACAKQLQALAIDKLEEFGLSRDDLEDMTGFLSQDLSGADAARFMRVEHVESSHDAVSSEAAVGVGANGIPRDASAASATSPIDTAPSLAAAIRSHAERSNGRDTLDSIENISYQDLVGYDASVALMRDFGVGMQDDARFQELVGMLNARHGLERMPAADTLLFRSPAREDANRFMAATLGELGLPAVRMHMEENVQGMPVLCVMAQADRQPKLNAARNSFEGPGVLMLEDLDLWMAPALEPSGDDLGGFIVASLSRGVREAVSLIRSAVEHPGVFVLASAASGGDIDPFFYDLLEPLSVIDIDYPTECERADIWMDIARQHPSVRGIDQEALVRYSAQMPRFDMYMAAREAVEEAYKSSLLARRYMPVTADNLFDKLAAYQPLDSAEYRALEDAVVRGFRRDLEHLDDLLNEGEE